MAIESWSESAVTVRPLRTFVPVKTVFTSGEWRTRCASMRARSRHTSLDVNVRVARTSPFWVWTSTASF
eukprot:2785441-Alexandrium_andersonii.AAC.1